MRVCVCVCVCINWTHSNHSCMTATPTFWTARRPRRYPSGSSPSTASVTATAASLCLAWVACNNFYSIFEKKKWMQLKKKTFFLLFSSLGPLTLPAPIVIESGEKAQKLHSAKMSLTQKFSLTFSVLFTASTYGWTRAPARLPSHGSKKK